jgi:uncharacterized membrane protein YqjE
MQPEDRRTGQTEDRSVGTLLSDLTSEMATLVRQELRLAQAEGSEKLSNAMIGVAAILGGLLIATCALLILLQALVIALADYMPDWLAALVVGVAVAIVAFIAIWQGRRNLSAEKLAPKRTMRTVRESTEMVMEKAR